MNKVMISALLSLGLVTGNPGLSQQNTNPAVTPSPDAGRRSPDADPAPSIPPGLEDLMFEPPMVTNAVIRLLRFKGISPQQFQADPEILVTSAEDLGRFFAYMAVLHHGQGRKRQAVLFYCHAVKTDPRYLALEAVPPDPDETFLAALQVIRLETVQFLADQVGQKLIQVLPSKFKRKKGG